MSTASPQSRPPRTDLPYLRRRYRRPAATPAGPSPSPPARSELDLSTPTPAAPRDHIQPARSAYVPPRTRPGTRTILARQTPTVTLTRIQSGIGVLTFEVARPDAVGDMHMGCAYRLRQGFSSALHNLSATAKAPPESTRPVIIGTPGQRESVTLDLRQSREVDRLIIYVFSGGSAPPHWSPTLVVTTFGQARIETSLDRPPWQRVVVLMSLYNVAGEFVLRAEMDEGAGTARDACTAYGFDQITWLDSWTPLN